MPRRPSKTNKNKRNARPVNRSEATIKKWNTRDDIPLDDEDQFHASRDRILLDDQADGDEDEEDEEVFALSGLSEPESSEEAELNDEGMDLDEEPAEKPSRQKKDKKHQNQEEESEDDSEEETWGKGRAAYYASNEADIDSDDEEALALEEQEAIRLQMKAREDLTDDDFGLNDIAYIPNGGEAPTFQPLPSEVHPATMDKKALIRHLEQTDPESIALARDWTNTAESFMEAMAEINQPESKPHFLHPGLEHLYYQTVMTYTSVLAFYLYLRADEKYVKRPDLLKKHPIIDRLVSLKQAMVSIEELRAGVASRLDDSDEESDDGSLDVASFRKMCAADGIPEEAVEDMIQQAYKEGLFDEEEVPTATPPISKAPTITLSKKEKKSKDEPPKKKRKTAKSGEAVPQFDLVEPEFKPSKKSKHRSEAQDEPMGVDAFGEPMTIEAFDLADKSARRKSLQFHTSRIESTSARRREARARAIGGDDDLPYRERKKDKEKRLTQEAKDGVKRQGGADLDDVEPEAWSGFDDDGSGMDDDEDGPDGGYYELVKRRSKEKKEKKKAEYEAERAAQYIDESAEDVSGPRSLTRAILANKGLTPHRSKSVRNPRVKKRQRFEKAKKKVASQKAVYKGGIGDTGRYQGEKSGISKVIKSVKLS